MSLTQNQRDVLSILEVATGTLSGPELAEAMASIYVGRGQAAPPVQGVHQTAASLSRRGLVLKNKEYRLSHPKVVYSITPFGRLVLNALRQRKQKSRFKK